MRTGSRYLKEVKIMSTLLYEVSSKWTWKDPVKMYFQDMITEARKMNTGLVNENGRIGEV